LCADFNGFPRRIESGEPIPQKHLSIVAKYVDNYLPTSRWSKHSPSALLFCHHIPDIESTTLLHKCAVWSKPNRHSVFWDPEDSMASHPPTNGQDALGKRIAISFLVAHHWHRWYSPENFFRALQAEH
jgi:hypothetical protein